MKCKIYEDASRKKQLKIFVDVHEPTYTKKRNSFSYAVSVEDRSVVVCKAAFLGLHEIEANRLRRKVINFSVDTKDNRGKHSNHPKVEESIKN